MWYQHRTAVALSVSMSWHVVKSRFRETQILDCLWCTSFFLSITNWIKKNNCVRSCWSTNDVVSILATKMHVSTIMPFFVGRTDATKINGYTNPPQKRTSVLFVQFGGFCGDCENVAPFCGQGCQIAKFDFSTLAQSKERKGSNFAAQRSGAKFFQARRAKHIRS